MFTGIKNIFTKVGAFLGIIKEIDKLSQLKKVNIDEDYFALINKWKHLHQGYEHGIHNVVSHSIHSGSYERQLATMNMPKVVTQELATLIFNERCQINVTSDESFEELIDDIFKRNGFNGNFQQYLEFMFAQGGMAIKPFINGDKIDLSYSTAETFLPITWSNNKIREAVFPSYSVRNGKYYTLLEWHVFNEQGLYTVRNELYESSVKGKLGTKVNLAIMYPDLTPEVVFSPNVKEPLFVYIKPNTANNIDPNNPLGISIYANSYDALRLIDTIYDSFIREYKLGRKRIIVSASAIKTVYNKDGNGTRYFDAKDETFEALDIDDGSQPFFQEVDSTLRIEEHVTGLNAALDSLSTQLGFSPGTFSFTATGGLKTATEVVSENSKTFRTKKSHENVIEQGITDLINVIAILGDEAGFFVKPNEIEVTVQFDDSIIQDRDAQLNYEILRVNAGLQERVEALRNLDGLSEIEAMEKLVRIMREQRAEMPDLTNLQNLVSLGGDLE